MQSYPPTQTNSQPLWEGATLPPLRMVEESPVAPACAEAASARRAAPTASPAKPAVKPPPRGSWFQRHSVILLCIALLSIPAYFLASRFVVTAVVIQGRSMMPTLKDGERYYLNRWRYLFVAPQRGDIVVIRDPGHNDFAVKRVVAQPFDWINLKNGLIYINGRRLEEPYLSENVRTDAPDLKEKWIQLGRDQYYVLGDNRSNSEDSRFYGRVYRQNILGHLIK
jgi:signal peptidase I